MARGRVGRRVRHSVASDRNNAIVRVFHLVRTVAITRTNNERVEKPIVNVSSVSFTNVEAKTPLL